MRKLLNGSFYFIFWFWNSAFLCVAYIGILPFSLILLTDALTGQVPLDFLLTLLTLVAVPLGCTIVAAKRFADKPGQLLRLFYGVEAPLFLLCLIRLFFIREVTAASSQVLGTLGLCILAFAGEVLFGYLGRRADLAPGYQQALAGLQLVCHTLMLLVGLWVGALLLFYAIPLGTWLVAGFLKFNWLRNLWDIFISSPQGAMMGVFLFLGLFVLSCGLFVAMPPVLATLYVQSWRRISRMFAAQFGWGQTLLAAGATLSIWLFMFGALQQQPQVRALDFLSSSTPDTRQILTRLKHSETIRQGLVNAYLMPYRYLSTWQESNHIQVMYKEMFGLPDAVTGSFQHTYNLLMSPFLYQGDRAETDRSAQLYAEFFDAPIQRNERQAIERALQSTYNREEAKAGVLNVNQQKVWLAKQEVTVVEQGDWAEVELHEAYENQTRDLQEIFYYFSLPESAAVTGLWLGDTDGKTQRFAYTVSPRGAAQQVYNNQVQERVDPALLEQVGPRQYRLRAFPIPVNRLLFDQKLQGYKPDQLHLWLTYKVMAQADGWALPQLTEKRNIYWTNSTERIYQGQKLKSSWLESLPDIWLPPSLKPTSQSQAQRHDLTLASDTASYQIQSEPIAPSAYALPKGQDFAVVLDTSRSMTEHIAPLTKALTWLKANILKDNNADLYLAAAPGIKPAQLGDLRKMDIGNITALNFYGKLQLKEVLQQYTQLKGNKSYDAVLVITDAGSYELSDDKANLPVLTTPVLMVHLGGILPPGYDDPTLKAIQDSGGAVSTDISAVVQRSATQARLAQSNPATSINVIDGYTWRVNPTPAKVVPTKMSGFQALAARQLITGLSKTVRLDQPTELDAIHTIAKQSSIVTPYSSMIVLVNDQQREELKKAEQQKDRFDREVETGNEQLTKPSNPLAATEVSGVPEPEEWLLMAIGGIILFWLLKRQRRLAN